MAREIELGSSLWRRAHARNQTAAREHVLLPCIKCPSDLFTPLITVACPLTLFDVTIHNSFYVHIQTISDDETSVDSSN